MITIDNPKLHRNIVALILVAFVIIVIYGAGSQNITGFIVGAENATNESNQTNASAENITLANETNQTNATIIEGSLTNITVSNESNGPAAEVPQLPQTPEINAGLFPVVIQNNGFEEVRQQNLRLTEGWHYKTIDEFADGDNFEYAYPVLDINQPVSILSEWPYSPLVSDAHSGSTALFVNVTDLYNHNAKISSKAVKIKPSSAYSFLFYVKNVKFGENDFGSIWIVEYDARGEETGFIGDLVKFNTTTVWTDYVDNVLNAASRDVENGWKEITVLFKTTAGGQYIKFANYYSASDESGENYYTIDDIVLEERN